MARECQHLAMKLDPAAPFAHPLPLHPSPPPMPPRISRPGLYFTEVRPSQFARSEDRRPCKTPCLRLL